MASAARSARAGYGILDRGASIPAPRAAAHGRIPNLDLGTT